MFTLRSVCVAACVLAAGVAARAAETGKPLFDGRSFSGWETWLAAPLPASTVPGAERDAKGNYTQPLGLNNDPLRVFAIEQVDGRPAIHVSGEGFGTLTTLESFSNYRVRLQFKWGEKKFGAANRPRNGGLLYHGYGNHGDAGGRWLHSHQFQIEEGTVGDYIAVGDTAVTIRARRVDEKKRVYDRHGGPIGFSNKGADGPRVGRAGGAEKPLGEWNTLELICVGDESAHVLNGVVVLRTGKSSKVDAAGERTPLTSGRLQLQIECAEIYFRDLEISPASELPAERGASESGP